MSVVQALTGSGGRPMSDWLTSERAPFFGGTYIPPRDGARVALRGFLTVLHTDARSAFAWQEHVLTVLKRDLLEPEDTPPS